jgi:hypothetical protein
MYTGAMPDVPKREPRYEDHFTAFVDFLGFREVSGSVDDGRRLKILELLRSLAALRAEFDFQQSPQESGGTQLRITPSVSTFSDHIVVSWPLDALGKSDGKPDGLDASAVAFFLSSNLARLLSSIAAAALRLGFLVRGGATIGKLYHSQGVVFGPALVEAFELESQTAIYPRIVLPHRILDRSGWTQPLKSEIRICHDGLYHFDYFKTMLFRAARPGTSYTTDTIAWFKDVVPIVSGNLERMEKAGQLKELAKWRWFAREFRSGLERTNPLALQSLGISLDATNGWSPVGF